MPEIDTEPTTQEGVVTAGPEPELSPEEKAKAKAFADEIKAQMAEAVKSETNPTTRPSFGAPVDSKGAIPDDHPLLKKGYAPSNIRDDEGVLLDRKELFAPHVNQFPRGDIDNFSVTRYAMAMERSIKTNEMGLAFMKHAPWETRYYDAMQKVQGSSKAMGDMVSGQDGGFLAPELWATNFIDMIYPQMVLGRLPITRIPMGTRVVHMPKLTGAVTIYYAAENASLTASQAQFSQLSFTARKQSALMQISNELIRDSNPTAEDILRNHATRYMAIDRDKQTLLGTGQTGAPVGLSSATNFTTTTLASNASPLFTEFLTGIYNVENLNGSTNVPVGQTTCTGIVGSVALKQQILSLKDTTNNRPLWDFGINPIRGAFPNTGGGQFDGLFGVPAWCFSNVWGESANSRHIWFGDWQHLYVLERQDVEIVASNVAGTAFQNDQTWIRLIARYDVGVAHPEAFFAFTND